MNLETKNKSSICIKIIINLFKKGMQYFLLLLKDKMNTETAKKNSSKISYTSTQRNNYERHIKPYFKNTNLNKLTYDHIFEFREYLKTKPKKQNENEILSYNTINKVLILLKKIFDTGIRKSLIDKNPVENLRKLPISKPDIK